MYNDVKLEKGLYNLTGKTFLQALEDADPSENYADTSLGRLDAFERQLKRFNIKINGSKSDFVEKFFSTTESAVLFPEFVRREIQQGIDESILTDIVAVSTVTDSPILSGFSITDSTPYDTQTAEGSELPITTFTTGSVGSAMIKIGRIISASYESVRKERIDVFAVGLRAIGVKLGNAMIKNAISTMLTGSESLEAEGPNFTYADLTSLYQLFQDFNMTTLIASPATVAKLLTLEEMKECTSKSWSEIILPFGASLLKSSHIADTKILAFDKSYALELATNSDLIIETDKLINSQLDRISVSINLMFKKLIPDAVKYIEI